MIFRLSEDEQLHLQGAFITPKELERVLDHARAYWDRKMLVVAEHNIPDFDGAGDIGIPGETAAPSGIDDKLFAEIILWALEQTVVSGREIERRFKMGYSRSSAYIKQLREMGIVGDLTDNPPNVVRPKGFDDLSKTVIDFLTNNGCTAERIREAFAAKDDANDVKIKK
jgi:DNA segregation ATPase FtsK/SpoIIIE-like protein